MDGIVLEGLYCTLMVLVVATPPWFGANVWPVASPVTDPWFWIAVPFYSKRSNSVQARLNYNSRVYE